MKNELSMDTPQLYIIVRIEIIIQGSFESKKLEINTFITRVEELFVLLHRQNVYQMFLSIINLFTINSFTLTFPTLEP